MCIEVDVTARCGGSLRGFIDASTQFNLVLAIGRYPTEEPQDLASPHIVDRDEGLIDADRQRAVAPVFSLATLGRMAIART
jgi:hypothetical protein